MKARKYQTRKLREQWYVHLDRFKHQKRRYILGEKKKKKANKCQKDKKVLTEFVLSVPISLPGNQK